jgi:hypothetical protein
MAAKTISQKRFAKLVASTGSLSQPPGAITRASNLLFTQRGSLQIADGSRALSNSLSSLVSIRTIGQFANLQLGQFPYYPTLGLVSPSILPDEVNGFNGVLVSGSGNLPAAYGFGIVATVAIGTGSGHTDINNSLLGIIASTSFSGIDFSWTAVPGATGYSIYYLSLGSTVGILLASVGAVTTYNFSGTLPSLSGASTPLPIGVTAYVLQFYQGIAQIGTYPIAFVAVTAGQFPSLPPAAAALSPGDPLFVYVTDLPGYSPYGGIVGTADVIPQIVQFAGQAILILGNGYAPQATNPALGAAASVTPLTNTFQAAYPNWQPSVDWLTGSQVTDGAGNYYTATQGGVSQTPGPPAWNTALGAETADGSVIWTSQGPIVSLVAPRGAAHAVAYAGSLWLANTYPTTTSDGIDGPTCLKMSDANNPNSWNPVNTAFIGRDDGTQITGMQPFTIAALGISPTGSLCLFKEFQTYQVIGVFGSTSFEIQPAQTNLGCLAARSIQFIPGFGVVRFSHLGFAVFDGINDRLISEDIRPYLFGGVDSEADLTPVDPQYFYLSASAQTTKPPMYLCAMPLLGATGSMTRLFCYDLVMKAWAVLDLPWPITTMSTISVGEGYPLVLAGKNDGSVQRLQAGDLNWDQGDSAQATVGWSFRSPDVFGEGSSQRLFYEQATLRGYGNSSMAASILANLWLDGQNLGPLAADIVPQGDSNLFEIRFAIFRNGYRSHIDFTGNNGGAAGVIDAIDWAVTPKSALARRVIG